ncbi:MAG: hypothetical protein WD048_11090 [Chitinophagales bacterium]
MKNLNYLLIGFLFLFLAACEKDDPEIPNEEELITTLTYTLTPQSGGDNVVLTFKDLDGDGGDAPEISSGILAANTTYNGTLSLLNEQESPAEDITEEIEEEEDEHQFFFQTTVNGVAINYDDADGDGNPIGLKTILSTGDAGSGTLSITLRHEPNKSASGVADGNIANAGGETDIEVTFNLDVQ